MAANPQLPENLLELVLLLAVVVSLEHAEKQALAKTARTYEYQVVGLILQQRDIHGLVYVILILTYYPFKVRHPIWYSFRL